MKSMTGFGKATGEINGLGLTIEISAVNHRYLDTTVKLPPAWSSLEPDIKQRLRNQVGRGKLTVTLSQPRTAAQGFRFDPELASQYANVARELARILGREEDTLSVDVLAQMDGVFMSDIPEADTDAMRDGVLEILDSAINRLDVMRVNEGAALRLDIEHRAGGLRATLGVIQERLPAIIKAYEDRLRGRIQEIQGELGLAEERIALEVALLADKSDVTEEVVRLKAHLDHMLEILAMEDPVGRRLDFLSQEIQREINTLGVKTRDADVTKDILIMKAEAEKIREQIQNIE